VRLVWQNIAEKPLAQTHKFRHVTSVTKRQQRCHIRPMCKSVVLTVDSLLISAARLTRHS